MCGVGPISRNPNPLIVLRSSIVTTKPSWAQPLSYAVMQAAPQVCPEEEAEKIVGELLEEYQEQEQLQQRALRGRANEGNSRRMDDKIPKKDVLNSWVEDIERRIHSRERKAGLTYEQLQVSTLHCCHNSENNLDVTC